MQGGLPRHLRDLVQAAHDRGVTLLLLPQGMSLRRANRSHFNRKASHIVWNVRVTFGREAPVLSMFPDTVTISHIVSSILRPSQVQTATQPQPLQPSAHNDVLPQHRQQQRVKRLPGRTAYALAGWAALPLEDVGVFLKLQAPAAVPLYKSLDLTGTLQQVVQRARVAAGMYLPCVSAGSARLLFRGTARNVGGASQRLGVHEHQRGGGCCCSDCGGGGGATRVEAQENETCGG
jgi:hypothetical protein